MLSCSVISCLAGAMITKNREIVLSGSFQVWYAYGRFAALALTSITHSDCLEKSLSTGNSSALSDVPHHALTTFHGFTRLHLAHETEATLTACSDAIEMGYAYAVSYHSIQTSASAVLYLSHLCEMYHHSAIIVLKGCCHEQQLPTSASTTTPIAYGRDVH